jgi:hypothetical protein
LARFLRQLPGHRVSLPEVTWGTLPTAAGTPSQNRGASVFQRGTGGALSTLQGQDQSPAAAGKYHVPVRSYAEPRLAGDAFQRPLRSRFQARLRSGVGRTRLPVIFTRPLRNSRKSSRMSADPVASASTYPDFQLFSLGWKAFQDLCLTVLSDQLGQAVQRYSPLKDGGRDGAFVGEWNPTDAL